MAYFDKLPEMLYNFRVGSMGEEKVFESSQPERDVWGDFNSKMANTFLVNLNELSKKETINCEGRIKALITDPSLTINDKGVSKYQINK